MATEPHQVVLDTAALKALAHPLRVQLLGALRRHGPSTATLLGQRLGVTSGAASYHLRQLAGAGLVAEDTARGNARDRWWRAEHRMSVLDEEDMDDVSPDDVDTYLHSIAASYSMLLQQTVNERATMPEPWRKAMDLSDYLLRLTPDEARTLDARVHALVREYRYDVPGGRHPEGAERVAVVVQVLPQLERGPEDDTP
ncbi:MULTISPECIES: winged helix-turn-helix domain-containing protein [Mumia]|uniref:winged helix-turn-helix domain-containing protein n=1 Tax=Mumia TaxID=1546255 RepID=UPI00141F4194|nr:helix-turn-helix domain-containing protein [Mumia sp. ZJ1417]QMW64677.1 helix-turn-helix transcriptional regulator [Mumia sp. ZJ1417]